MGCGPHRTDACALGPGSALSRGTEPSARLGWEGGQAGMTRARPSVPAARPPADPPANGPAPRPVPHPRPSPRPRPSPVPQAPVDAPPTVVEPAVVEAAAVEPAVVEAVAAELPPVVEDRDEDQLAVWELVRRAQN